MSWAFKFVCEMYGRAQDKPWMKHGAQVPYFSAHAAEMHQLPFVKESLFRQYCSGTRRPKHFKPDRGGSSYRHNKLYKLYWRLHGRETL